MSTHKGPVFIMDDENAKAHNLAVRRLLNLLARLLEEDGCEVCAETLRHAANSYTTIPVEELDE